MEEGLAQCHALGVVLQVARASCSASSAATEVLLRSHRTCRSPPRCMPSRSSHAPPPPATRHPPPTTHLPPGAQAAPRGHRGGQEAAAAAVGHVLCQGARRAAAVIKVAVLAVPWLTKHGLLLGLRPKALWGRPPQTTRRDRGFSRQRAAQADVFAAALDHHRRRAAAARRPPRRPVPPAGGESALRLRRARRHPAGRAAAAGAYPPLTPSPHTPPSTPRASRRHAADWTRLLSARACAAVSPALHTTLP